ncbi:MAG: UDP-N-acetyl-D-mannosamine dehydrogenase [Coxiellaceae bacterium]|nr:UDP-N-acetyl-D-mannosamine dehydrogenase [Coxiellaceae bacterium]
MDLRVCIIGLGYIGLPTAALLANHGFQVLGVDINPAVVKVVNEGEIHIVELGLEALVKAAVVSKKLSASLVPEIADVFIISVPTPFTNEKQPDLSYVMKAAENVAPFLRENNLVILESTSPVGTTHKVQQHIYSLRPDLKNLYIAYCPERVIPGRILKELIENDRIVGGVDEFSTERARWFYSKFVKGNVLVTDACTAEMTKLTENAFRDVNIAFANELSMICDELKLDVWELIRLANHHPRVDILQPGPGVGGHCIAVDPWFIVSKTPDVAQLIKKAREVNMEKKAWVIRKIKKAAANYENPTIACLGITFKPDVDDLRESPAKKIVESLMDANVGKVIVCEPHLLYSDKFTLMSADQAILRADIVVVLVDHREFKNIPLDFFEGKIVIDTRGCFTQAETISEAVYA